MARKTEVPITGSVLAWAMDEAGYDDERLAARAAVDVATVRAWKAERQRPGRTEFSKIVDALRRPSAIFYLPSPPTQAGLPTRFRHAPGLKDHVLSADALREIRKARRVQQAVAWALRSEEAVIELPYFDWTQVDATEAGARTRSALGVAFAEQVSWPNLAEALRHWRAIFDEAGMLVFSLQLGKEEIRGFSAWDDVAPLIAVNSTYVEAARIFTMAHEMGHLVSRTDSACFDWVAPTQTDNPQLERWCETFAAAFLLPPAELESYVRDRYGITARTPVSDFATVWKLSRQLKVSARSLAIALTDANLAPKALYALVEEHAPQVDRPPERKGGGSQPVVQKRLSQYGFRAPNSLIGAVDTGALGLRDVADYLELSLGELQDLGDSLGRPREVPA